MICDNQTLKKQVSEYVILHFGKLQFLQIVCIYDNLKTKMQPVRLKDKNYFSKRIFDNSVLQLLEFRG